jgi:hypothetical protein
MPLASLILHGSRRPGPLIPLRLCSLHQFFLPVHSPSDSVRYAVKSAKSGSPSVPLQKLAVFPLFTIEVHSELSPIVAGVHPARFSVSLNALYNCCTTETASWYLFVIA